MKHLFYKATIVLAGLFMACSPSSEVSDDTTSSRTEDTKGMTTFGGTQANQGRDRRNVPVTRTSLDHSAVGVTSNPFFWESGDNLWVKKGSTMQKSSSSDIKGKVASARFYFNGLFDDSQYQVYYRGDNVEEGNKVVVATLQTQESPNSSKHFGASGDCGTATATRGSDGIYGFSLQHKAAYLCIVPRMTDTSLGANTHLTQVKIISDATIAGTYDFSTGELTTPTNTSKEITVKCGTEGFPLTGSTAADALATAGVYAVIAPGTHKLRLEYTITDKSKNITGIVYQYINSYNFAANTLTDVVVDLNTRIVDISQFKYYTWDATRDLFADMPTPPHLKNETGTPATGSGYSRAAEFAAAVNSLKDAPNINETLWYLQKGNPMTEEKVLYKYNGHLYLGMGLWLKKQQNIPSFSKEVAPDGQDYRRTRYTSQESVCPKGRPDDPSQYFFLPAMGYAAYNKIQDAFTIGAYWTSTASAVQQQGTNYYAHGINFWSGGYGIYSVNQYSLRNQGYSRWKGE